MKILGFITVIAILAGLYIHVFGTPDSGKSTTKEESFQNPSHSRGTEKTEMRVNSFLTGTNSNNTYFFPISWEVEDKGHRNTPEAQVGD